MMEGKYNISLYFIYTLLFTWLYLMGKIYNFGLNFVYTILFTTIYLIFKFFILVCVHIYIVHVYLKTNQICVHIRSGICDV
jgi:hypothetical protein